MNKGVAVGVAITLLSSGHSMAQSATSLTDTEISKDTENPVTRRITVPLRYEADFNDGADSGGSRPRIRDDVAHHSDLMSLGVPR
jgi:hypothetical protein